ncbi:MAG: hypothetical protein M1834_008795 [Cirrosporium novae-zelandiae]|nr:MAG: hypothetical protein M1834_008795 [Cirrosporium novae-zelandiae]
MASSTHRPRYVRTRSGSRVESHPNPSKPPTAPIASPSMISLLSSYSKVSGQSSSSGSTITQESITRSKLRRASKSSNSSSSGSGKEHHSHKKREREGRKRDRRDKSIKDHSLAVKPVKADTMPETVPDVFQFLEPPSPPHSPPLQTPTFKMESPPSPILENPGTPDSGITESMSSSISFHSDSGISIQSNSPERCQCDEGSPLSSSMGTPEVMSKARIVSDPLIVSLDRHQQTPPSSTPTSGNRQRFDESNYMSSPSPLTRAPIPPSIMGAHEGYQMDLPPEAYYIPYPYHQPFAPPPIPPPPPPPQFDPRPFHFPPQYLPQPLPVLPASVQYPPSEYSCSDGESSDDEYDPQSTSLLYSHIAHTFSSSDAHRPIPLYRKFSCLNHRLLLHLQSELGNLELELDALDNQSSIHYSEFHHRRLDLMSQIFSKTQQYNRALTSFHSIMKDFEPTKAGDLHRYRRWVDSHVQPTPATKAGFDFLRHPSDLLPFDTQTCSCSTTSGVSWNRLIPPSLTRLDAAATLLTMIVLLLAVILPILAFSSISTIVGRLILVMLVAGSAIVFLSPSRISEVVGKDEVAGVGMIYAGLMVGLAMFMR